jgi:xylulose-5-phosphate/fructose-6-phosphate phosphoketolase
MNMQIAAKAEAYENGIDPLFIRDWRWPFGKKSTLDTIVGK